MATSHQITAGIRLLAALALVLASACGGTGSFGLSSGDNDSTKLAQAFATVQAPPAGPINSTGKPMVFLAARGKPKQLVAFDLESKKEVWRVEADISSKVVVGRDFVAHKEGDNTLVGRDITTGSQLWSVTLEGTFVGAAADSDRVYFTMKSGGRKWILRALSGKSGEEIWDAESNGALGAPAARGGLVFSPFMKQWLAILDAKAGTQLTRIRGIDQEISFVRTTPEHVYFGSKAGVFLLDERAASGKRAQSTYGNAKLPEHFIRVHYYWDAFDPVQAGYSAYDRNRVLWNASAKGDALAFSNDLVAVQTYRFFFGFSASTGELSWAYNHPRVDIVASAQLGTSIGMASMLGEIGALDPATGERIYEAKLAGQFIGGTFDAAGWAPNERTGKHSGTAAALVSIARDRDARFNDVKKFAVTALSQLKGGDVTRDLLVLIQNEKTPPYLLQTAADVLVSRKDPEGLAHLVEALSVRHNYVTGAKPRAVGVAARAIAALDPEGVNPRLRGQAVEGLIAHLTSPSTAVGDLVHLVRALGRIGAGAERSTLSSFLLVYRADPTFATQIDAVSATIDVLLSQGGTAEREIVAYVAEDKLSQPSVAEYAKRALVQRPTSPEAEGDKKGSKDGATAEAGKAKGAAKTKAPNAKP
ncbi:MAG: PQQ-binding-like beta-propeller repeat protein [Myxococcales bacterium]|nr:PQQ-binding-like beta-propeller repeat protein [Myxococcales bacterium]